MDGRLSIAAPTRTPRSGWVEAGLAALAKGGPDAVRIDALAKALGVTRGGFYWHFDDRQALLDELLDAWERRAIDQTIERAELEGGDAQAKAQRAGALTFGRDLLPIDLAVRGWARRDRRVARRLRRVDNRRMDYLRAQLGTVCSDPDELEARCLTAFAVATGHHFVAADHPGHDRADVLALITDRLFAR